MSHVSTEPRYAVEQMGEHCDDWCIVNAGPSWQVWVSRDEAERQVEVLQAYNPHAIYRITPFSSVHA